MVLKVMPLFLIFIFCVTQVSALTAGFRLTCIPESKTQTSCMSSREAHRCCWSQVESCCCDVSQKSTTMWPDMNVGTALGAGCDLPSRGVALETVSKILSLHQSLILTGRWNRAGPPLGPCYLLNLTLRC